MRPKHDYAYISREDFERIIAPLVATDLMFCVIVSLCRYRGLSPIDACALRLQDVKGEEIVIRRRKTGYEGTRFLAPIAMERLRFWIKRNTFEGVPCFKDGYLFRQPTSKYPHVQVETIRNTWRKACITAGFTSCFRDDHNPFLPNKGRMLYEHRLYDLRGSFATDIYKATEFDIVATTAALGNTDTRSTIKLPDFRQPSIQGGSGVVLGMAKKPT